MSEILTYGDRLQTDAQVVKMGTFTSKGGGLMVQVQLPLDRDLAGMIATHLGNIARMTLEFSGVNPGRGNNGGGSKQPSLFPSGPSQPAPADQIHEAGEELISSTCPSCGGNCYRGENNEEPCEECGATGVVYRKPNTDTRVPCPTCEGRGNVQGLDLVWGPCVDCGGTGKIDAPAVVPALILTAENIEAWKAELDSKAKEAFPDSDEVLSETSTDDEWLNFYGGRTTDDVIVDEKANQDDEAEVPAESEGAPEGGQPEEPQAS